MVFMMKILSQSFPSKGHITVHANHREKGNLDIPRAKGSELALMPSGHFHDVTGNKMESWSQDHAAVLRHEYIIDMDMLGSWQKAHTVSLVCGA